MTIRIVAAMFAAAPLVLLAPAPAAAQAGESSPRTPWGHPDLQGIWSNSTTTPMERPEDLAGREFLTEEERAERNVGSGISAEEQSDFMPTGAYNDYWLEKGELSLRTSLIVDPPDGRYPPRTPEAEARRARRFASFTGGGELASWEDFSTYDRCLTRGMPGAMTPGFYNHNYQIFQTPDHVVILVEMIHDARVIRLGGSAADGVEQWLGQSTGRWEGDTLVIETTSLEEPQRRVVERLTRTGAGTMDYRVTVSDEDEWTGPWTALMPMSAIEGPIFEYACHEGNYALPNMLAGKRAEEAEGR